MAEEKQTAVAVKANVGDEVISRVNQLSELGFVMPKDYNHVNAIKMSMIKLKEVKDKYGKSALEVCTSSSIQGALFKMVTKGLNLAYNQCYAIVRGNQLCIDPSYFGNILMVKRIFPDWEANPRVIRDGDEYVTSIDPKTGRKKLVKHEQKLENIDKDFIGGYIILPTIDGEGDLYEMTKKQIITAWSKSSSNSQAVHKQFDEKMIGKTLINSGCTKIINGTPDLQGLDLNNENAPEIKDSKDNIKFTDYEEVNEVKEVEVLNAPETIIDSVNIETGEVTNQTPNDDNF